MEEAFKQGMTMGSSGRFGIEVLGGTLLLVAAGIAIYVPWKPVPFDILDFSEFLPLLQPSTGPLESFNALLEYYESHGRVTPLSSALIALEWQLLGPDPSAWRWFRVGLMSICIALTIWFLRRLNVRLVPALLATSLLLVSTPAAASWLRLTAEPLAFIWFALGLILVTYTDHASTGRVLAVTSSAIALVLTKETDIVLLVPLWLFALGWHGGRLRMPKPTHYSIAITLILVGVGLASLAVAWTSLRGAGPDAYVRDYDIALISVTRVARNLSAIFFPLSSVTAAHLPHGLFFLLLLVSGWYFTLASRVNRASHVALALTMSLTILLGALVYLPWVRFEPFYALPFLLPVVVLFGAALDSFHDTRVSLLWPILVLVVLWPPTVTAKYRAERTHAHRTLDRLVIDEIARVSPDSLFVYRRRLAPQPWQGRAATMARYVRILDRSSTVGGADRTCDDLDEGREIGSGTSIDVTYHSTCGDMDSATTRLRVPFKYWTVPPAAGSDTLGADLRVVTPSVQDDAAEPQP